MGVRGLTTYIRNHERRFLKQYKLHNCTVLLDGNSIAANLFIWSNIESAFGGDYDKFAKYVTEFFKLLQKCEIKPLVLFDGGYEQRKLRTVYTRLREKFRTACQAQPCTGSLNFPLFLRVVFREVLTDMKIPFAQSDFEADDELAALARLLKCPVLSYDSDFYIYDVLYIPLPSLNLIPVEYKNSVDDGSGSKYYLDCKMYSVDTFIESFGGLDKNMLPLLAALLGNDYIKRSIFSKFYRNLKIPKGKTNHLQRRIKAVIEWLRHETFESAVHKILSRMKKNHRRFVIRQIKRTVNGYIKCKSILSDYLGVTVEENITCDSSNTSAMNTSVVDPNLVGVIDSIDVDSIEDNTQSQDVGEESQSSSEEEDSGEEFDDCELHEGDGVAEKGGSDTIETSKIQNKYRYNFCEDNSSVIPKWLLDFARRGKIQSCVFDILSLQQYFFPPQVEDYSLPPSHLISLNILNAIVGLLHGENGNLVTYWTRNRCQLTSYIVEPIQKTPSLQFPPCDKIPEISETVRKAVLLEVAEVEIDLTEVPEEWHLFIVAIVFWLKNMKQPAPTEAYLHTIVMCLVGIYSIDSSIGIHRNRQTFIRKYKNFLNKVIETRNREKENKKESNTLTKNLGESKRETENEDINKKLSNISREDCVVMFETILPYHHLSEEVKKKPKSFCLATVHAFAQFQSGLFHLMVLNSVLAFPLRDCFISHLFSGTFVYNFYQNFSKRNNITTYVETLFQHSPSLLKLHKILVNFIKKSVNDVSLLQNPGKLRRKKKKQNREIQTLDFLKEVKDVEDGETFIDENNMFSVLCLSAN